MRMHVFCSGTRARLLVLALAAVLTAACGDKDDPPTSPSPTPSTPSPSPSPSPSPAPVGAAALRIENFSATVTQGTASVTYRASLTLRETGGVAATVTGVTLTLTQTSGATASSEVAPADAFTTTTVPANGTLPSRTLSITTPPVQASQLTARITFTDANGRTGTVQATTDVVPA